jgi:integrase/recombinase XerD
MAASSPLSQTAQQALGEYERHLVQDADLSRASVRNYLGDVTLFAGWYEQVWSAGAVHPDSFVPGSITTPTLTRYRDYLKEERGLRPATINRYLISLKRYFGWALSQAKIQRDPAGSVKLVNQTAKAPRHLSDKEEADLVAAVEREGKLRDIVLITLMLHTGLRVSEVCALKWEDITVNERSGALKVWGKRNKHREVPLNVTVRTVLMEYRGSLEEKDNQDDSWVFTSQRTGGNLTPRGVRFIIDKYAQRAGIEDLGPHDLRHRFAYRMAERTPLHRLAQIMGHGSLDTTMIYIQGTQRDLQNAVEAIAWQ